MRDPSADALGLSYELAATRDPGEIRTVVRTTLEAILPNEATGWVAWSRATPAVIARWPEDDAAKRALSRHVESMSHPVLLAIGSGARGTAIRTTDLIDAAARRRAPVFRDLLRVMGVRFQLVLPAVATSATTASTWALHRVSRDFDDDEVVLATRLAPLLRLVDRGLWPAPPPSDAHPLLTAREAEVLRLLSAGMTTAEIAWATRISARTVAKHIEHVYTKLDVHDRVSAARAAVRLGLAVD